MSYKIPAKIIKAIKKALANGATYAECSRRYGVGKTSIIKYCAVVRRPRSSPEILIPNLSALSTSAKPFRRNLEIGGCRDQEIQLAANRVTATSMRERRRK